MSINLHIERLILEGLPPGPAHSADIGAAAEAELTRLLGLERMSDSGSRHEPHLSAAPIALVRSSDSRVLGQQIAGAVHQALSLSAHGATTSA